ncbi:Cytochrome monooxygenase lcsI [Penicillium diatomitis]|uniref:Cytochrome monooxygenase lcsI n=1 Tax=Penicillium diatomitis TaxID=2819901 RepID=A0A9X0BMX7_9EURO|nr:Cytochrome monooxygenase lcsI [Penicillium diatomitis]KAJ5475121.1 Cytochrome monooxygenase lcsI [Penicillium diatomitis]
MSFDILTWGAVATALLVFVHLSWRAPVTDPILLLMTLSAVLYKVVYELYWSPLGRFPGPKLWAITPIPSQLSVVKGYNHLDVLALHEQYGPVVRLGPRELAFFTARAFRDVHLSRPGGCLPKDPSTYSPTPNGVDNVVTTLNQVVHARQRRLLAPAFSERALKEQEGLIMGYIDTLIAKLRAQVQRGSSVVDMKDWFNFTLFDITGDLMFGQSFDCLRDSQLHSWIGLTFASVQYLSINAAARQFPLVSKALDAMIPKHLKQKSVDHFNLAARRVDHRLESNTARPDFISAFLQNGLGTTNDHDGKTTKTMSRAELHANAFILIIAGSETTATLLSGCVFLLCSHSEVMRRLVAEVRSSFVSADQITFESTAGLPYLGAVIEESLRMYPPVANTAYRRVPAGGLDIDGEFVPEGARVGCHHYASNRSSANFALPHDFIPERWLGTDSRFVNDKRDVLQPFSLGPRGCIGRPLAYCEMRSILCKLLYNFDISLCPESKNWIDQQAFTVWKKPRLAVTLRDRFEDGMGASV